MPTDTEQKVAVIGLGYIGLPTAALIARSGAKVLGVDVSAHVVDTINSGKVHIEEVDLDGLVQGVVARGTLRASLAVEPADVFVIAVPTPVSEDNAPDISYVLNAARTIAPVLTAGNVVILESTSPVGTTEAMRDLLAELRPDLKMPHAGNGAADIAIADCFRRRGMRAAPFASALCDLQNDGSRYGVGDSASFGDLVERRPERVERRDHRRSRRRQRIGARPFADQAIAGVAGLDDGAADQAGPFCLAVAVRIEESALAAGLHPEFDDVECAHDGPPRDAAAISRPRHSI